MEETLANPRVEARPLSQSERPREERKEEKEGKKERKKREEVEPPSYIKGLWDAAGSQPARGAKR